MPAMTRAPSHNDFSKKWFDDFAVGDTWDFGDHLVTKEEILAFGQQYDPEPFHRDEELARGSIMGELIASGIQMMAWVRNMQCLAMTEMEFSLSPGWGDVRFVAPVRPGDRLRCKGEVVGARRSDSRPGVGIVNYRHALLDAQDEIKFTCQPVALHQLKPADAGGA
jgi:acyl dehydratase